MVDEGSKTENIDEAEEMYVAEEVGMALVVVVGIEMVDIGSARHIPCIFSSVPSGQLHWNEPARFSHTCVMLQISWLLIKASTHSLISTK